MQADAVSQIAAKIRLRNKLEVDPYLELIASHQLLQRRARKAQEEIAELNAKLVRERRERTDVEKLCATYKDAAAAIDVPAASVKQLRQDKEELEKAMRGMARLHELEHANQAFTEETKKLREDNRALEAKVADLQQRLTDRDEMVAILKKEVEALKAENRAQQEHFKRTSDSTAHFELIAIKAKQREAELMDQIFTLETQLCELRQSGAAAAAAGGGSGGPPKEAQFTANVDVLMSSLSGRGCVVPSYIAHQMDDAHDGVIDAVTITENSRHIWTGGTDKMLKCWELSNGTFVNKIPSIGAALCLDSAADLLVTGCVDSTCRVYELGTLRGRCQLTGHQEKVCAAYFSSDAQRVFSASSDRTIKTWDVSRGSLVHTAMCFSACNDISVVNDRICSAHFDTTLRLWDARTGKESGEIVNLHDRTITSVRIAQDGNTVVSLSRDNTVRTSDIRMLRHVSTLTSDKLTVSRNHARIAISPDGTLCAVGSSNGCVIVWSLLDPSAANKPTVLSKGHSVNVPVVVWAPDGRGVVSVGDKRMVMWR